MATSALGAIWIYVLRPHDGVNPVGGASELFVLWMYVFTVFLSLFGGIWLVRKQKQHWDGKVAPFVWVFGLAVTWTAIDPKRGLAIVAMMLVGLPFFTLLFWLAMRHGRRDSQ